MIRELKKPFTYDKIKLDPSQNKKDQGKKIEWKAAGETLYRLWTYVSRKPTLFYLVIFMVVASSALGLLGPYLIGMTIDEYIVKSDSEGLMSRLWMLVLVFVLYSISLFLQNYWMIGIAQTTVNQMREDLFQHFHRLPIAFFDKRQHGELMSRVTNDIENVSSTLNSSVIQVVSSVLTLIGTVVVMLTLSPLLTAITLLIIPIMLVSIRWITSRTSKLFKLQQKNLGELNGYVEEVISGQKLVKAYSREERVIEEFVEKSDRLKKSGYWAQTITGFIPKVMNLLNNASFAVIAFVGGIFAINGYITIGVMVIFAEYARQFTRPLNDLANQFNTLLSAIAGAERVFDILDEVEEEADEDNVFTEQLKGKVEFKNVSFGYEEGEAHTLHQVSFVANRGETIALVGPTGAGKTTLINLVSRFYDPDEGEIQLDGKNSLTISRHVLRRQMGFVLQDTFLFQGTILENIRYGRLNATDEEVIEAAKKANAHSFIERLPEGYQTKISHDGGGISHGQKQLLAIARAFVSSPRILILDEATSSIDTITELKIQEALGRLMDGRTTFVIAHRLNTIRQADQIIVLKEGRILEQGSHEQLVKAKGFYYGLG
ncbi:multidrug ABC transporter ATP-binding protein [Bacillus coahuilensis m2-6]|uniref:ABC transporter ATP-binding protein n=2 Tax=Bacillus coahuilensis TaxID=408580 RepID=UPI0007505BD9|nr:ABC transporter ATP-binding protein [Bacillus coahuilensis]KUP09786.1 multidrug ABC transporter ATP-binding protein [Bacillus coahuilensis m2-6]